MNDNYQHDVELLDKLRKRVHRARVLIPLISVFGGLGLYVVVSMMVLSFIPVTPNYVCEGVDANWLVNHPFDVEELPKKIESSKSYVLSEPSIIGYKFIGWFVNDGTYLKKLEDNTLELSIYGSSGFTVFQNKVTARYEPIQYSVSLFLDGGGIDTPPQTTNNKHRFTIVDGYAVTSFICVDEEFNLPTALKDGFTFDTWKDSITGVTYDKCTPSTCINYNLTVQWK